MTLSNSDLEALAAGFGPLDELCAGLSDRLVHHVAGGEEPAVLDVLARTPEAAIRLGLEGLYQNLHVTRFNQNNGPRWDALIDHSADVPGDVLLRLAKVLTAAAHSPAGPRTMGPYVITPRLVSLFDGLSPPAWPEVLLRVGGKEHINRHQWPRPVNRLPAGVFETVLERDGQSAEFLYEIAFPTSRQDHVAATVMARELYAGLSDYGSRLAIRREVVLAALSQDSAALKTMALDRFQSLNVPVAPFVEPLARLATESARTVREPAAGLLLKAGQLALAPLRDIAGNAKPEARGHALRLIARLDLAEGHTFLNSRQQTETSPAVRKVIEELTSVSAGRRPGTEPRQPEPPVDPFVGVALGDETRLALRNWAAQRPANDVENALARMVDPEFWSSHPPRLLAGPASSDVEGLKQLLARPDLTPLHMVRFLRLAGILQVNMHEPYTKHLDFQISGERLDAMLTKYREAHSPRIGYRELAAAFRASGLDEDLIVNLRFQTTNPRRIEWEVEAIEPYFATRLDWLALQLDPPPGRDHFAARYLEFDEPRTQALAILDLFQELPARFIPRLWEIALGTSKTDRPRAQKVLEKTPDCANRLFEALRSGKAQVRTAAAEWLALWKPGAAAEALGTAIEAEKSASVKAAMANALETVGGAAARVETKRDHAGKAMAAVRAEAVKGRKKGIPDKLAWFPFDRLPEVRWQCSSEPVERPVLEWLIVSAWKTKASEPTAILRDQVVLLRPDDASRFGQFVFDAWLAADLRPQTPEERRKRLEPLFQMVGVSSLEELIQKNPDLAKMVQQEKDQPASCRTEDKGLLAITAAAGPTAVIEPIRSYVNQWYGYRAAQCRALIIVLAWIDHPEAVAFLLEVARRFRTATIRQEADVQACKLAERKGISLAELADRSLPDAGFDASGRVVLDFGPRQFMARLDDDAEVVLEDGSGTVVKSLPAPNKSDDAALAAAAKTRIAEIKKEVKTVRKRVVDRLYEAMCTQRSWSFSDWERSLLHHPIAGRLCRRVVWTVRVEAGEIGTFRPLEDGTLTDLDDGEVRPDAGSLIRTAHPMTIGDDLAEQWSRHLADFEIPPLLQQLSRPVFHLTETAQGLTALPLNLPEPLAIPPLTRRARGLGYDPAAFRLQDGGGNFIKHFPSASLRAEIAVADFTNEEKSLKLELSFQRGDAGKDSRASLRVPLGEIPAVLLSECHADLLAIGGSLAEDDASPSEEH